MKNATEQNPILTQATATTVRWTATVDLYLDQTGTLVVAAGDPRASQLLCKKGDVLPDRRREQLGLNETSTFSK